MSARTALGTAAAVRSGERSARDVVDESLGTGYLVQLPGSVGARCNPVTAPPSCDDEMLADER